jgi:protein-tyrosine phosphatase
MQSERIRILFVCLGNICRSPLAEAIFREEARRRGVEDLFDVDSAGTSSYHAGCGPDRRSVAAARRRGVQVTGTARQVTDRDLHHFHYVIAMDGENYAELDQLKAAADGTARIHRLREWDPQADSLDVPDPYYSGSGGFERVHEIVERCCARLLNGLLEERVPARR